MARTLFIFAGEPSGDMHGAMLVRALREREPDIRLAGVGSHRMREAGVDVYHDLTSLAAIGILEVAKVMFKVRKVWVQMVARLDSERPDAVVLIDYPMFNLRIAREAHARGIPVIYYVTPQFWAWRRGRAHRIARYVDLSLCVFPFEPEFFARYGAKAKFIGHPLLDILAGYDHDRRRAADFGLPDSKIILGLLPGSRHSEIKHLLKKLLRAAELIDHDLGGISVAVAPAPLFSREDYESWQQLTRLPLHFFPGRAYDVMAGSDLLLVASGTATLEAGIIGTPMIVTYTLSWMSILIAPVVCRFIKYYSLVNLVAGHELVPEIMGWHSRPENIARKAVSLVREAGLQATSRTLKAELRRKLGEPGAAGRAADEILALLATRPP